FLPLLLAGLPKLLCLFFKKC
uniref:Brevinin-1DYc n=1 Tax=Rana dybowskii TaxID=71582 RepID=BR1C_RANDY|nr:RecName: Full=Brevinin-1DYc [Rana dybowskii]